MTIIQKMPILRALAAVIMLTLLTTLMSGCAKEPDTSEKPISSPGMIGQSGENAETLADTTANSNECYFYEGNTRYIRLVSEDITASFEYYSNNYNPDENPRFKNLVPLYEDIPQEKLGKKLEGYPQIIERDWEVFAHRLSEVHYNLKVHYSLESEINKIIMRLLSIDDVIPPYSEMFYDEQVKWLNTEIFDQFVRENVNIEIIGKEHETDDSDLMSGLSWQVYSGGCFANYGPNDDVTVCSRHLFNVWLVGFSDTETTVWSMKYVEEPGCGERLPLFEE